jgi:hypothetical protein
MRFHEQPVPQFIADDAVRFHKADWSDLPTMHHVVNALAALPVSKRAVARSRFRVAGSPTVTSACCCNAAGAIGGAQAVILRYCRQRCTRLPHPPHRNLAGGVEVERLEEVRRSAAAEPRCQSVWS